MQGLRKLLDISEHVLLAICAISFAVMFVLGIATVVFRFVIESSLAFPDELIRYLFIWMIALGAAVTYRRNMHAAIGVLVGALPEPLRKGAMIFATLVAMGFFAVILVGGYGLTLRVQSQISPALEVSMAWVYAAIPVGMIFLLIYAVELLFRQIATPAAELSADGQ